MPIYLKIIIFLCAEVFIIVLGGVLGVWLTAHSVPASGGTPAGDLGMLAVGVASMSVAGMVGGVGLVIFWSVLALRQEAAVREIGEAKSSALEARDVWPPPPNH